VGAYFPSLGHSAHKEINHLHVQSGFTLLIYWHDGFGRERYLACKTRVVGYWHGYLSGARDNLHMVQMMPLPLTVSCFSKIHRLVLPFRYRHSWVVLNTKDR